jgi:hypothetical protein
MNTIAKCIGHKYPKYTGKPFTSDVMETGIASDLKPLIADMLFKKGYDYVLINYTNNLYICEKTDDIKYSRRQINYHPFQHLVQL